MHSTLNSQLYVFVPRRIFRIPPQNSQLTFLDRKNSARIFYSILPREFYPRTLNSLFLHEKTPDFWYTVYAKLQNHRALQCLFTFCFRVNHFFSIIAQSYVDEIGDCRISRSIAVENLKMKFLLSARVRVGVRAALLLSANALLTPGKMQLQRRMILSLTSRI